MLRLFQSNHPLTLLVLLVYGILLRLPLFMHPVVVAYPADASLLGPAEAHWMFWLQQTNPIWLYVVAYLLSFLQGVFLSELLNRFKLLPEQNYYPAAVYITISAIFTEWHTILMASLIMFLVLWVLMQLVVKYRHDKAYGAVFDIGLAIGLSFLLQVNMLAMIIFILFAFVILRAFVVREWLNLFVGIVVPSFLAFTWYFYDNRLGQFVNRIAGHFMINRRVAFPLELTDLLQYSWLIFGGLYVFVVLQARLNNRVVLVRKMMWIFFHLVWMSILAYFLDPDRTRGGVYLLILPISFFFSYYLCIEKRLWLRDIFFLSFVALVVLNYLPINL